MYIYIYIYDIHLASNLFMAILYVDVTPLLDRYVLSNAIAT